jgi:ABC-type transport system involved in cytochrome c biogenesis permease subunit
MTAYTVILLAALCVSTPAPDVPLPNRLDLDVLRSVPAQYDGRWPPLDTVARDLIESVTGDATFEDHDPTLVLLAWTFDSETWKRQRLIPIYNAEVRRELQLPESQTVFSFSDLIVHGPLILKIRETRSRDRSRKLDPLESKVLEINEKLAQLQGVFNNEVVRLIPDPDDSLAPWQQIPLAAPQQATDAVHKAWTELQRTFYENDRDGFTKASQDLKAALNALPAAYRPPPRKIATELLYNRTAPFSLAWYVMVAGAALSAVALAIRRKWFDVVVLVALIAGFAVTTFGLWLRWHIAGRIPASNMYESLLFLGWGTAAFAIVSFLAIRHRMVPLTASVMGALALMLADILPLDHYVRPIQPVLLDTIWMSVHVPIIMVSYSVLALAVLIAHVQLFSMAIAPNRSGLARAVDSLHYWYVLIGAILLGAGIITGSMWGASAWGRYWGWDPKEVWSLVAFLGYLAILHVRADHQRIPAWGYVLGAVLTVTFFAIVSPYLRPITPMKVVALLGTAVAMVFFVAGRGRFATAVKSIAAFWLIVMTYVGVNYVLGIGLHSYGFGTGAMARWMLTLGFADLALVLLCGLVYLIHRSVLAGRSPAAAAA